MTADPFSEAVCVFRPSERTGQADLILGRHWSVPVCQAAGGRRLPLAEDRRRRDALSRGAIVGIAFFASQSSTEHGTIPLAASLYPSSQQASRLIRPGSETLLSDLPRLRKQAAAQIELLFSLLDATEDTDT